MSKKLGEMTYKEIYGQEKTFAGVQANMPDILKTLQEFFAPNIAYDELIFTGCGTSLYLAQSAAYTFGLLNNTPAKAVPCSELYFAPQAYIQKGKKYLVLPITRKSFTSEVRMAIDKVRALAGVRTLAITCDENSKDYNDGYLHSAAAQEDSIVMTRSYSSMLYISNILAYYAAGKNAELPKLESAVQQTKNLLELCDETAKKIVEENPNLNLFICLGQGAYYGVANECMNKMKEMGIVNSEAYYPLEYRHGPMSLVDENTLILLLFTPESAEMEVPLLSQMQEYGGITAAVGAGVQECMAGAAKYCVNYPMGFTPEELAPVMVFIGQLIGYHIACKKGLDADTPRNLSQAIVIAK